MEKTQPTFNALPGAKHPLRDLFELFYRGRDHARSRRPAVPEQKWTANERDAYAQGYRSERDE